MRRVKAIHEQLDGDADWEQIDGDGAGAVMTGFVRGVVASRDPFSIGGAIIGT